jgi:hypothetical protein
MHVTFFHREIGQCFTSEKGDKRVNFVYVGDSRVRNIFEFSESLIEGKFTTWDEKPHHNIRNVYDEINFTMDFLWGPQTDYGNQ